MFMVWDGNHRLQAWLPIINNEHKNDPSWHFAVESIILVVNGDISGMLTALHKVNWYVMNPIHPFYHYILQSSFQLVEYYCTCLVFAIVF
jgi:hypothetical protein